MKRKALELLARTAFRAGERADKRASEFGLFQPKKPEKTRSNLQEA